MAPAQLSGQRPNNLDVGVHLGEFQHTGEVVVSIAHAVVVAQFLGQRPKNPISVVGPFFLEDVAADAVADAPVDEHESRVDGVVVQADAEPERVVSQRERQYADEPLRFGFFGHRRSPEATQWSVECC